MAGSAGGQGAWARAARPLLRLVARAAAAVGGWASRRTGAAAPPALAPAAEAARSPTHLLALISHELKTPLNIILGYLELLDRGVPEPLPEAARVQVARMRASALALLESIDEMITFSRLQSGEERVETEVVAIGAIVRGVVATVEPWAAAKGLAFRVTAPDEPAAVETDPTRTRQVLLKLLSNAVKFTEKGEVALEAALLEDGRAVFRVRDTGPGIAPAHLPRIFEPFWQADQSITRRAGGSGLGLAVASGLTRLLRGELKVESTPGVGSTFTLSLPRTPGG